MISALEAGKWRQITFCILTNILNSISERFGPKFEQIDISQTATAIIITVACIRLIDKLKLSQWPVIGKVRRELGLYCYLQYTHSPTHSNG